MKKRPSLGGGPQGDRDKMFPYDDSADLPHVPRADLSADYGSAAAAAAGGGIGSTGSGSSGSEVQGELYRVKKENALLKDQLNRAMKELKAYQVKYPSAYAPTMDGTDDELPPWMANPEIMTPLFVNYDTRIRELEEIVSQQMTQLEAFREKTENVVAENEELRHVHLERLRSAQGGSDSLGPMAGLNTELLAEMNERVEILMEENGLLVEQKAKLSATLEELQDELGKRTYELSGMAQQLSMTDGQLKNVMGLLSQAERDREEAAGQTVGYSEELGNARSNVDKLREQLSMMQKKYMDAESGQKEAKRQLATAVNQAEENNILNMRRTKTAEDRVRDLHGLLLQKTQELDSALEVGRKLRREYQSTRQDAEGMLQVMGGLERQVADYHEREDEVERLSRESKERVEDALSERDQAFAREQLLQKEVERLTDERRQGSIRRQEDIDAALEVIRQRAHTQKKSAEDDLKALAVRNGELMVEAEKAIREAKSYREQLERMHRIREDERKGVDQHVHDLEEKVTKTTSSYEEEKSRREEVHELNKDLRSIIDKLRLQMDAVRSQVHGAEKAREAELLSARATVRDTQRQLVEKTRTLARKNKELDDLKGAFESQLAVAERKFGEEATMYRKRSSESDRLARDLVRTHRRTKQIAVCVCVCVIFGMIYGWLMMLWTSFFISILFFYLSYFSFLFFHYTCIGRN